MANSVLMMVEKVAGRLKFSMLKMEPKAMTLLIECILDLEQVSKRILRGRNIVKWRRWRGVCGCTNWLDYSKRGTEVAVASSLKIHARNDSLKVNIATTPHQYQHPLQAPYPPFNFHLHSIPDFSKLFTICLQLSAFNLFSTLLFSSIFIPLQFITPHIFNCQPSIKNLIS